VRRVSARDGSGDGRGELALPPSLAERAALHRRARRGPGDAVCTTLLVRRARDRLRVSACRRPLGASERPPATRAHDEPSCGGRPRSRHDLKPACVFGRLGRGDGGLLAPRRRGRGGRGYGLRSGCRKRRRGLLDARRGRRRLRLHRRRHHRGGGRWNHDSGPLGQERKRVEVTLLVDGPPNAEVHVRLARDRVGALSDRADACAFPDLVPALHGDRAELQQRHGVAVAGADRQGATSRRNGSGERHGPRNRRAHRLADRTAHVDPPMLPRCIRVRPEDEGPQHRSVDRPRPRLCAARKQQREQRARDDHEPAHRRTSFVVGGV